MNCLPREIILCVLEFSGPYNFVNRQVCSEFRLLVEKVDPLVYLDQLLADGRAVEKFMPSKETISQAIDKQLIYVLSFTKNNLPENLCHVAACTGKLQTLQWAMKEGFMWDSVTLIGAAENGHLEVVKWLRKEGCPWYGSLFSIDSVFSRVALAGHLEVIRWCVDNGCPYDEDICPNAARGGHLEILQWAKANHYSLDEEVCFQAAEAGHLEVLQWLREQGCPWDESTTTQAAANGHLEILQWAYENGCPMDDNLRRHPEVYAHDDILEWLENNQRS
jgi:hypothetical protein